jgi:hypothetical protein
MIFFGTVSDTKDISESNDGKCLARVRFSCTS